MTYASAFGTNVTELPVLLVAVAVAVGAPVAVAVGVKASVAVGLAPTVGVAVAVQDVPGVVTVTGEVCAERLPDRSNASTE